MIMTRFERRIDIATGELVVWHSEPMRAVFISYEMFGLTINECDLKAVIGMLGRLVSEPSKPMPIGIKQEMPPLRTAFGGDLNIGRSAGLFDKWHIWISSGPFHLRLELDDAMRVAAALSEARAFVDKMQAMPIAQVGTC